MVILVGIAVIERPVGGSSCFGAIPAEAGRAKGDGSQTKGDEPC